MDVEKHVEYWRGGALEDWEVGEKLVGEGKTRHGLFFVHLALEKALKALVTRFSGEVPPRSHNLVRLAELAELALDENQLDTLADINQFQIEGRYPESVPACPAREEADAYVVVAKEMLEWLMSR